MGAFSHTLLIRPPISFPESSSVSLPCSSRSSKQHHYHHCHHHPDHSIPVCVIESGTHRILIQAVFERGNVCIPSFELDAWWLSCGRQLVRARLWSSARIPSPTRVCGLARIRFTKNRDSAFGTDRMKVTVLTADERIVSLDVEPDELVENLKAILEVETQVPLAQQQILFNGKEIPNASRLNASGVGDNDLLMLVSARAASSPATGAPTDLGLKPDGTAINPIALIRHIQGDPNIMRQLQESNRELAQAISNNNVDLLQDLLRQQHQQRLLMQQQRQREIDLMNADPFDVEAQKRIEEAIQQKNVDENWEAALEYNPEAFGRVIMLYVDMEVNGFPLKAFVDSGAQSTIISKTCAERCGLLRLMDKRYRGIAKGVGQSEIVGRIHVAPLKIGQNFYPCSFTVLDQPDLEFIFGLDMLRKHQCSIDLKDNVLRVGGGEISVPFLQENQLPLHLHDDKRLEGPASSSGPSSSTPVSVHPPAPIHAPGGPVSAQESNKRARSPQEAQNDSKVQRLMELGFDEATVTQALSLFNGNEDQAASYLFGGFNF